MEKYQMVKEILNELVYVPSEHPGSDASSPRKSNPIRPRSYEDFNERVKTYLNGNWAAKPVNPLICSQYGWKCVEKDLLQCSSCRSMVVGSLPQISDYYLYVECCDRLLKNIKSGHKTLCPWANLPSPSSFTKVTILEPPHMEDYLLKQLTSLVPVIECYPGGFKFTSSIVEEEDLFPVLDALKLQRDHYHVLSLTLVIMGWELDESSDTLKCNYCHRKLSLKSWSVDEESAEKCTVHLQDSEYDAIDKVQKEDPPETCIVSNCSSPEAIKEDTQIICNTLESNDALAAADTDLHECVDENKSDGPPNIYKRKTEEQTGDSGIKKQKKSTLEGIICDQHRYWCPWIDSDPPGWRQFLTSVNQLTFTKHNTSLLEHPDYADKVRGILKIRSLMEEW